MIKEIEDYKKAFLILDAQVRQSLRRTRVLSPRHILYNLVLRALEAHWATIRPLLNRMEELKKEE